MARTNFSRSLARVLVHEGGYSDHPRDPGGKTMWGIIQSVYDAYRKRKGLPTQWVRQITEAERDDIYRTNYWNAVLGDELPSGVDYVVFDGAVNSGPVQSIKWLQRALGMSADGHMGDATMAAIAACQNDDQLVADICSRRLAFLKALRTWPTFGKGWERRVREVKFTGQAWANNVPAPKPTPNLEGDAKAPPSSVSEASVSVGQGVTASTANGVVYGVTDQLQSASTQLAPLSDTLQVVKWICLGIGVICAGLTIYAVWRSYKAQRARNGEDTAEI